MTSGPITLREIEGEKVEAVADFLFLGSKITADDDCSHEIRRRLLLSKKAMTNLDHCWKADITLLTKVSIIKVMVLDPVVTYYCESWNVEKVNAKELKPLNCGAGEDSGESLRQQGDQTTQS